MTRAGFLLLVFLPAADKVDEARLFEAVNRERTKRRMKPLAWNARMAEVARKHSRRMAEARFFSHQDPQRGDLVTRLESDGIRYSSCAENIYRQSGGRDPVAAACAAWMKSAGHRANILGAAYRESGIGAAVTKSGEWFVTQIFRKL